MTKKLRFKIGDYLKKEYTDGEILIGKVINTEKWDDCPYTLWILGCNRNDIRHYRLGISEYFNCKSLKKISEEEVFLEIL